MRILALIIAILGLIITIAFTIFPIGNLTILPALITIICGIILIKLNKNEGKTIMLPKIIIGIALLAAIISSGRALMTEDVVAEDVQFEQKEEDSKEDAVKDLEGLE